MRRVSLVHEFVDSVPSQLDEGTLYVSIRYRTAVHLCACGCGNKVVTPIKPAKWHLTFDGDTVSLSPSIGNWQFPCRSHYWVRKNRIRWARAWTDEEIQEGRERDADELREYYADHREKHADRFPAPTDVTISVFSRLKRWLSARRSM